MRNALAHAGSAPHRRRLDRDRFRRDRPRRDATQWREVADQAPPRVPKLATLMDEAEPDVLAYMGFPAAHRAQLLSTNPLERLNKD